MNTRALLFSVAAICLCGGGTALAMDGKIDFVTQVKPILSKRCVTCHQSEALFGNVNLENHAMAFKKRPGGPVILPGKPDSSMFFTVLVLPPKDLKAMPPTGHRIPDHEKQIIYDWIKGGADWPEGPQGVIVPPQAKKPQ